MSFFKWVTPNQLTLARMVIVPLLLYLIVLREPIYNVVGFGLFALAGLTDYLDGVLARSRDEVSPLGKLLDPIADKMLVSSSLIMLVYIGIADVVPTIVILMRDFAVSGLRQVAAVEGVVIEAEQGGKLKTMVQMLAIGFMLLHHNPVIGYELEIGRVLLWASMVLTLSSGFNYFQQYFKKVVKSA